MMRMRHAQGTMTALAAGSAALLMVANVEGHSRGNHAGDWTAGQSIRVCVDTPPGDEENQAALLAAVQAAIDLWNDSKAGFKGGVTFEIAEDDCDVQLGWNPGNVWGSVANSTDPVPVEVEPNDGLTARGVQRVLMHELGHVKGLGHSALSDIMKWNYRGQDGNSPTADDLNGEDAFEEPNDDDIALNKILHGKEAPAAEGDAEGEVIEEDENLWRYNWFLQALPGPGLNQPITRFTVDLPPDTSPSSIVVDQLPPGWQAQFLPGEPGGRRGVEKPLDPEEQLQPAVITFFALSPADGLPPGSGALFSVLSSMPPTPGRAYTNSPSLDSNEFMLPTPGAPSPVCPGDLTGDNTVNADDLFQLLGAWGPCPGCPEDLTGDNDVNADDLFQLLGAWGDC